MSGANILCLNKDKFDKVEANKKLNKNLKVNYYNQSPEWNYKNIKPKIICEKVLKNKDGSPLIDYRFLCFNGVVKIIFIDIDTCDKDGSHCYDARRNVYDENMNLLDVKVTRNNFPPDLVKKPENFIAMKNYAQVLSEPFPHCRVDLYNIDGQIFFGEITFYHAGGNNIIYPNKWNLKMGEWIDLKSSKILKE